MSKSTIGLRRAGLAVLATSALVMGATFAGVGTANADESFAFERVDGRDRYVVSAKTAQKFGNSDSVILASGEEGKFGDALTASYLAGDRQDPVMLTELDATPQVILDAIKSLNATKITIVGGPLSVSDAQMQALKDANYTVDRVWGQTRYDTAAKVIETAGDRGSDTALIATGEKFPDALSAGPLAYAKGMPIGTVTLTDAPDAVVDALKAAGVSKAIVLGGNLSVGAEVRQELRDKNIQIVDEFDGRTRGAVSQMVAEYGLTQGLSNTRVNVASGRAFSEGADALGGGALSGEQNRPILITDGEDVVGPYVLDYLSDHANTLTGTDNLLFGGLLSIGQAEEDAMEAAARNTTTNQDFTVSPSGAQAKTASTDATTNEGRTAVTVTGLDDAKKYDVALFPCANVTTSSTGVVTFADADGTPTGSGNDQADGIATTDTGAAIIESANNGTEGDKHADNLTPVNGTITFTVDSLQEDCAVAVVFEDTADDDILNLGANNQPTDLFAVTGDLSWTPRAAASGAYTGKVTSVDKIANTFALDTNADGAANVTLSYDGNDAYTVGVPGQSQAQFEAALSTGDSVTASPYNNDPAGVSSFTITADTPAKPTVAASVGTGANSNDITLTITPTDPSDINEYDSFVIQRATVTGTYTTIATATSDEVPATAGFQFVDDNVAAGTYRYQVAGVVDGDQGEFSDPTGDQVATSPAAQDTTRPTSLDVRVATNTGSAFILNDSDSFKVVFSEVMDGPDANDTIRLRDEDGTVVDLVNGDNATFSLNTAAAETVGGTEYPVNRVLTVVIDDASGNVVAAGTLAGLGIPATATVSSGVADLASNEWNLGGSADVVIDNS